MAWGAEGFARRADLPARMMLVGGSGCVILGGLVAAVTGPLGLNDGSWLAAYLVLVCGVGSYAIGGVQARSESPPMPTTRAWTQLSCWGAGNLAVIAGTVTAVPAVVDVGVPLLVIGLVIALVQAIRPAAGRGSPGRLVGWAYRCLLIVLIASAPVGSVLAHLRNAA